MFRNTKIKATSMTHDQEDIYDIIQIKCI
uniref:Uncharacterized protein n=1 Tax=Arundo donax TaxID=35708 RepID=A0A0A9B2R6_ARUDO